MHLAGEDVLGPPASGFAPVADSSHREILRATAVLGGSQVLIILLSAIRAKVFAVLLGPAGIGIAGMYLSITGVVGSVAGLGIRNSGVRQIAEAVGTADSQRIGRSVAVLRRVTLLTGVAGALALAILAFPLSRISFGSDAYGWALVLLSLTVLFGQVSNGQYALLQGFRRIGDLARVSVLGVLAGVVVGIPLVYLLGVRGIALSLLAVSVTSLAASWVYARRIPVQQASMTLRQTWTEARPLLRLGAVFMTTGLIATATAYFLRVLVARGLGTIQLGLYQAGATLAGLYVGMIIGAMVADYYPRLTAAAADQVMTTRLVNEQAEVGLLVAVPGVLATMVLAPLVIRVLYSAEFLGAVPMLQWQALGLIFQVMSWPLGYVLLAKGDDRAFFWTQTGASLVNVPLIWLGITLFGLVGTGIAFFAGYLTYSLVIFLVVRRRHGFSWSSANIRLWLIVLPSAAIIFGVLQLMAQPWAMVVGGAGTLGVMFYVVRRLNRVLGESAIRLALRKIGALVPRGRRGATEDAAEPTDVSGDPRSDAVPPGPPETS